MVRDPNFWRRFSIAVHQDDAAKEEMTKRPNLKHSDSWLESQKKKQRQRTWICWSFWLCLGVLVAGIVVTLLILKGKGII